MKVRINGKEQDVAGLKNLYELVEKRGLSSKAVVIEHNYNIVSKDKWRETILDESDNIEIVSFVGGG